MIKVSVIVPVYNVEKYLKKCLESCVSQTLDNIEVIIINDGSLDNSEKIAQEYADKYEWMTLITTENQGLSEARNEGIRRARGKYLYFLDSDDWIDEKCLEKCFSLAEDKYLELVTFDAKNIVEDGMPQKYACKDDIRKNIIDASLIYTGYDFIQRYEQDGNKVQAWLKFIRKDFVLNHHLSFPKGLYYEDVVFHYDCMRKINRMMYISDDFYNHLYRENSIVTSKGSLKKIYSVYSIFIILLNQLNEYKDGDAVGRFWVEVYGRYIENLISGIFSSMTRMEIESFLTQIEEIQEMQCQCISLFWKYLERFSTRLDVELQVFNFAVTCLKPFGIISDKIKKLIEQIAAETDERKNGKFTKLPFDKKETVGVYGAGKHAKAIFENYENLIGKIKSNIVFIETDCNSYEKHNMGCDVISIKDVPLTEIRTIVILSFFHEEEMYKTAKKYLKNGQYNLIRLYDGDTYPLDIEPSIRMRCLKQLLDMPKKIEKRIVLMNVPEHTNIGDHIITYSEELFLKKYFGNIEIVSISGKYYRENRQKVKSMLTVWDTILITGGGFLGSMWADGDNTTNIIRDFRYNKIIVFPQSLYFENNDISLDKLQEFRNVVMKHSDIVFCFREEISLERMKKILNSQDRCVLLPDMALLLSGRNFKHIREGALLCIREDRESVLSDEQKYEIELYCQKKFNKIGKTSMHHSKGILNNEKEDIIYEKWKEFSNAELVITDTLHCMISCALTGTPCIAFNNISGKIQGVYEWIKDLDYIMYLHEASDIFELDLKKWAELHKDCQYNFESKEYEKQLCQLIL